MTLTGSPTCVPPLSPGPSTRWIWVGASPGADDLLVPVVADEQDVVALGDEPPRLVVHQLPDQPRPSLQLFDTLTQDVTGD